MANGISIQFIDRHFIDRFNSSSSFSVTTNDNSLPICRQPSQLTTLCLHFTGNLSSLILIIIVMLETVPPMLYLTNDRQCPSLPLQYSQYHAKYVLELRGAQAISLHFMYSFYSESCIIACTSMWAWTVLFSAHCYSSIYSHPFTSIWIIYVEIGMTAVENRSRRSANARAASSGLKIPFSEAGRINSYPSLSRDAMAADSGAGSSEWLLSWPITIHSCYVRVGKGQ